jgi:hypothetical protein
MVELGPYGLWHLGLFPLFLSPAFGSVDASQSELNAVSGNH